MAAFAAFFMTGPAAAQMMCGPRNDVVANLAKGYAEHPVSMGMASNGAVIEVFLSDTGTFTIVMTRPDGLACLMAAGDNWEAVHRDPPGLGIGYLPVQLEFRPSCAYYTFGAYARLMSVSYRETTMQVVKGDLAAAFVRELAKVPDGMRRDSIPREFVPPDWRETVDFVAFYKSPWVSTTLMVLVDDPCVVMATALDTGHVEKMLEQARERS